MSSSNRKQNRHPPDNMPLAFLLDNLGEVIQVVDAEWNVFYINQAAADLGGKKALKVRGNNVWAEFPELVGSYFETACRHAMQEQVRIDFEFYFARCAKWLEIHLHPTPHFLTLYATEITRRVQAEARVEHLVEIESLNARLKLVNEALTLSNVRQHELTEIAELLSARLQRAMQESHHRVKNNLQVIAALVEIQIGEDPETASNEQLKRINQHVRALASIHDLLTQQVKDNSEAKTLSTSAILERLIPMLQQTSGGRPIHAELADIPLPTQKAASLALLVSECIGNAVKHATGEIEVKLRLEGNQAHLVICDRGNGFAPDFDWQKATRTGLSLIDATARCDLHGEVHYENQPTGGGRVAVTFPVLTPPTNIPDRLDSPDLEGISGEP